MRRYENILTVCDKDIHAESKAKLTKIARPPQIVPNPFAKRSKNGWLRPPHTKARKCAHRDEQGQLDCSHFGAVGIDGYCLVHHIESIPPAMRPRMEETT